MEWFEGSGMTAGFQALGWRVLCSFFALQAVALAIAQF